MKKLVIKVDLQDDKGKRKAMKAVSTFSGIDSLAMDMKKKEITVIGDVDPVAVLRKLRKQFYAEIVTVGPAKAEKKDEKKEKKENLPNVFPYNRLYPYPYNPYYHVQSAEENPSGCVIS